MTAIYDRASEVGGGRVAIFRRELLRRHPTTAIGGALLLAMVLSAIFAPLLPRAWRRPVEPSELAAVTTWVSETRAGGAWTQGVRELLAHLAQHEARENEILTRVPR